MKVKYKYINDRYTKSRGGESHIYQINCANCRCPILLYQKDGIGTLYRLYLDRIVSPSEFMYKDIMKITQVESLKCPKCNNILAVPMIYEPERRLAFRILRGAISKKLIK